MSEGIAAAETSGCVSMLPALKIGIYFPFWIISHVSNSVVIILKTMKIQAKHRGKPGETSTLRYKIEVIEK